LIKDFNSEKSASSGGQSSLQLAYIPSQADINIALLIVPSPFTVLFWSNFPNGTRSAVSRTAS